MLLLVPFCWSCLSWYLFFFYHHPYFLDINTGFHLPISFVLGMNQNQFLNFIFFLVNLFYFVFIRYTLLLSVAIGCEQFLSSSYSFLLLLLLPIFIKTFMFTRFSFKWLILHIQIRLSVFLFFFFFFKCSFMRCMRLHGCIYVVELSFFLCWISHLHGFRFSNLIFF